MWASIKQRSSDAGNSFVVLIVGGLLSFGVQTVLLPFTFLKGDNWDVPKKLYTLGQIWLGGFVGWIFTIFNTIWLI